MTNEEVIRKIHEEVALRGLSPQTEKSYLYALRLFLRYYENRPIETMGEPEIREFLLYQISIQKTNGTVNIYNSALRFIFGAVLARNLNCRMIPRRHDRRDFPAIMSRDEIVRFFSVINNLRDKAMFETAYGAGLRRSEIVHLRVQDIDSKQMRIFVHHGKGGKDRFTLLSQRNLDILRKYWKQYRPNHPEGYLFYARSRDKHILTSRSVDNAFNKYKAIAGLSESYTLHTLRHCFATHLLESGVDVCQIKELLGHTFMQSTTFYLHLSNMNESITSPLDTLPKKRGHKPKLKKDA
jgi:integrase/recombinase XerD